ncbi:class I SAM-dependent methyltransferase [Akkermansiaceae bacterium]|nr:class I SAM-dependent methyltransferase [Akkermansiaceae bacterium]MDA7530408.1 class I SAM-dependent methyltransferase [bacterium]MDA7607314.1 class I SAM-dependent methyltransferase [Akkermansiaceae bacterium]MDB2640458.1 class I SAM-dependent methyltransferase [Akkermansiaceae bacterium]MDC0281395.1 class I SAM-dependent methyltransferase [Akkermansiaceae bacterium]
MKRQLTPEILDSLPGDDPGALRSRRDLRLINFLMGNERWILKQNYRGGVIELGAGEGKLTQKLAERGQVVGLDFQERPDNLEIPWLAGDLFHNLPEVKGETIVANLILHHFRDDQLAQLGKLIRERRSLIAVEPWRSRISLAEGYVLWPLINRITKHDMIVSIRAGFRNGELRKLLDLGDDWEWKEEVSLLGGLRVLAWRK